MNHRTLPLILFLTALLTACGARYNRMQQDLHALSEKNQADTVFTSTSEAQRLVHYFSHHGTPNERMLAHYLLGRAYSDMHDAPRAMECFKDAVEAADTASNDCDKKQLGIVTCQLGKLYFYQSLYDLSLKELKSSSTYSLEGGDTLGALVCQGLTIRLYKRLGQTDSIIEYNERLSESFRRIGREDYASSYLINNARLLVDSGNFAKAKACIDNYELKSGFFDSCGNIEKGREVYYYIKGNYYMSVNQYDSAEYWFRKELRDGRDYNNQNAASRGLALLFQQVHKPDSAAKYALYSYEMNDSVHAQRATEMVAEANARYDYTRNQLMAQKKEKEMASQRFWLWVMDISVLSLAVIAYLIYTIMRARLRREEEIYMTNLKQLSQAMHELEILRGQASNAEELIAAKEKSIRELEMHTREHENKKRHVSKEYERLLKDSPMYAFLEKAASKGARLEDGDLDMLHAYLSEELPGFMSFLSDGFKDLNRNEYYTCLLIRMYMKPSAVSSMLGFSVANATKIRSNLLQKMFQQAGQAKDFDHLIQQIY